MNAQFRNFDARGPQTAHIAFERQEIHDDDSSPLDWLAALVCEALA